MHTIIYTSREAQFFSDEDIETLLVGARSHNQASDITGVLLYFDLVFFQVLEGPKEALEKLFARIVEDSRHKDVMLQVNEPISARLFPNWSMAYRKLDGQIARSGDSIADTLGFVANDHNTIVSLQQHRLTKLIQKVAEALGA
ncbi:MAG: BLUF domain-containing protein [Kordiimonadaceae bacterium]|nr:BLUF domain-containing protein [Kordiimonadaceae bacterium]MBO6569992.1 BLUF domain-containing protein [Kordiimonadaceae bacterium]MBO6965911.1 BLUF domain-containing protein [Kordiimonadaceae bacterium]